LPTIGVKSSTNRINAVPGNTSGINSIDNEGKQSDLDRIMIKTVAAKSVY